MKRSQGESSVHFYHVLIICAISMRKHGSSLSSYPFIAECMPNVLEKALYANETTDDSNEQLLVRSFSLRSYLLCGSELGFFLSCS